MRHLPALLLMLGCAPEIHVRPPAADPANPAASASKPPPPPTAFDEGEPFAPAADDRVPHAHEQPRDTAGQQPSREATRTYTCPMHPEVRASEPGRCPKCGMALVPAESDAPDAGQADDHGSHH